MDLSKLEPGRLYAVGSPLDPKRVVLIDPDAWRWHPDDAAPAHRYVHPSGRRLRYKRVGARTGVNTGSLVLRSRALANSAVDGNNSMLLAVEPITTLRRGLNPSGTGNDTGLVGALTQGPNGEFQPWVRDLLVRYGLHFDLVDPRTIVSTWEDWEAGAPARDAALDAAETEAQQEFDAHDALIDSVAARLAELGVTYSRSSGREAQVADFGDRSASMTYEVLAGLLARIPS